MKIQKEEKKREFVSMSDLFWDSIREKHAPRVAVFLSRGGKGSSVKNFQPATMRKQIQEINDNVLFVATARDAEYIVIPNDANLLADPKTHARTKMFDKFLTMLQKTKVSETPVSKKKSKPKQTGGAKVVRPKKIETKKAWQSVIDDVKSSIKEPTHAVPVSPEKKPVLTFLNFLPAAVKVKQEETSAPTPNILAPRPKIRPTPLEMSSIANIPAPPSNEEPTPVAAMIQPNVAPKAAKVQKPKPGKATFPCGVLMKDVLDKFANEEGTFDDIKRRVKSIFSSFNDELITRIAWFIEDKLQPEDVAEKGEPDQDPMFLEKKKGTQESEDFLDELFNDTMREFNKDPNPTDEDYEAMLDDLESNITQVMRQFSYKPRLTYLQDLATELWTFRDGYSSADVATGIQDLVDEWNSAYFEETFEKKYQQLTLTDSQQTFYEKLLTKIETSHAETMQLLFKELAKTIRRARKHDKDLALKFKDPNIRRDIRFAIGEKYPDVNDKVLRSDFAKFWKQDGFLT